MKKLICVLGLSVLATAVQAETLFTGDVVNGVKVISQLDVADLEAGKTHRFLLKGSSDGIGQTLYIPVIVAKGAKPGPKLVLNSGNHGDEVNGIRAVQQIMAQIDPASLSGSVVAVTGSNPNAINRISRSWASYTTGEQNTNFNRVFPGKEFGSEQEQHAWLMWNKLWKDNAEYVLDFHTIKTGHRAAPFYMYADYRDPHIQQMAELFPADQIKQDPGEKGTTETEFVDRGIPAITLEFGEARSFNNDITARAAEGTRNVMIHLNMLEGKLGKTAKTQGTYIGNKIASVFTQNGGYTELLVDVGDNVTKGQKVATQLNIFGDVVQEFTAPQSGKVLSVSTDAVSEPHTRLVRILMQDKTPDCEKGC